MDIPLGMSGHEAEIIIPGSFVALQGMAGDGMANTIDTPPELPPYHDSEFEQWLVQSETNPHPATPEVAATTTTTATTSSLVEEDEFMDAESSSSTTSSSSSVVSAMEENQTAAGASTGATRTSAANTTTPTVGQLAARNTTLGGLTGMGTIDPITTTTAAATTTTRNNNGTAAAAAASTATAESEESFVVVSDNEDNDHNTTEEEEAEAKDDLMTPPPCPRSMPMQETSAGRSRRSSTMMITNGSVVPLSAQEALEGWNRSCRSKEQTQKREWQENVSQLGAWYKNNYVKDHVFMRSCHNHYDDNHYDFWWLTSGGKIAILRDLPTQLSNGTVLKSVIGSVAPGSTVIATQIVYLNSQTLQQIRIPPLHSSGGSTSQHCIYPKGKQGWIVLIKIDNGHGRSGYVTLSLDGYPLLAPGLPSMYTDPHCWIWRVTCPAGAFVREGLDLNTRHIDTIPYGSLVRVLTRTVNGQGLCRLRVSAIVEEELNEQELSSLTAMTSLASQHITTTTSPTSRRRPSNNNYTNESDPYYHRTTSRVIDGWCSEFLNPLSGNRGNVLQPLPFPVPALYKVTLAMGAVIRSDIELSSHKLDTLPQGSMIRVVRRAFSEHPVDSCLERIQLAGGGRRGYSQGGWMSVRLNRPAPLNEMVVELIDTDSTFDPEHPGLYHWRQQMIVLREQQQQQEQNNNDDDDEEDASRELSSIDSDAVSSNGDMISESAFKAQRTTNATHQGRTSTTTSFSSKQQHSESSSHRGNEHNPQCLICLTEDRNATIVHGETGHVACCLLCARILRARGDKCPVCRLPIDLVIQHFWA